MPLEIDSRAFVAGLLGATTTIEKAAEVEVQRVGREAAVGARRKAPVLTGTLAGSITARPIKDGVEIVATAPYAPYVEYGTSDTPSQPFLRPALNEAAAGFGKGIRL